MERFVLQENIRRYQDLLGKETDETQRQTLARLLVAAEREQAMLAAENAGIDVPAASRTMRMVPGALRRCIADFERDLSSSGRLVLLLDPGPGLPILDASATYVEATMTRRADLIGRNLFDVFPDNPADPGADGVANLYASLRIAAVSGKPHRMPVQRYDVRDSNGAFVERYWQPVNTPLMDSEGHVVALLHEVTDVTATCRPGA